MPVDALPCASAIVVVGDTLRCGRERLRLLGLDASELNRCPPQRKCVTGDPRASNALFNKHCILAPLLTGS
jgi:hypothetical protein